MDTFDVILLLFMLLIFSIFIISFKRRKLNLPPSPPNKLPLIGHLHQLGDLPHHDLQRLAQKHGPVMMVNLGPSPALVISSPQAAKEIMKTHDLIFSSRPNQAFAKRLLYDKDIAFLPYGEYWRQMRKLCILEIFNPKRVQSFRPVREEEVEVMIQRIRTCAKNSQVMDLSEMVLTLTNNVICRVAFGKKYSEDKAGKKFGETFGELFYLLGVFNVGDIIPWLSWVNHFNGLNARVEKCFHALDSFFEKIIEDHFVKKQKRDASTDDEHHEYKEDLVDILLGINDKESLAGVNVDGSLGRDNIKAIILDMFAAGTEASHAVLECAMAELVMHPQMMKRAQDEVREILKGKEKITEDDLNKMDYLQCVIKETLRLHPPGPMLIPRESREASKIQGYDIPAKTTVFVNAYAIARDPDTWKEPNKFEPERFMNSSVDYKGVDFELIPFGAGRRGCPGIGFATATIELALASLLYRFDWKLPKDSSGDIDMTQTSGLVVHLKNPVLLVPTEHHSASSN